MAKPDGKKKTTSKPAKEVKNQKPKGPVPFFPKIAKPRAEVFQKEIKVPIYHGGTINLWRLEGSSSPNRLSLAWWAYAEQVIVDQWGNFSWEARQIIADWASKACQIMESAALTEAEKIYFEQRMTEGSVRARRDFWGQVSDMLRADTISCEPEDSKMFQFFGTSDTKAFTALVRQIGDKVKASAVTAIKPQKPDQLFAAIVNFDPKVWAHTTVTEKVVSAFPARPGAVVPITTKVKFINDGCSVEFFDETEVRLHAWNIHRFNLRNKHFWVNSI